jgi:hypothetical protein
LLNALIKTQIFPTLRIIINKQRKKKIINSRSKFRKKGGRRKELKKSTFTRKRCSFSSVPRIVRRFGFLRDDITSKVFPKLATFA